LDGKNHRPWQPVFASGNYIVFVNVITLDSGNETNWLRDIHSPTEPLPLLNGQRNVSPIDKENTHQDRYDVGFDLRRPLQELRTEESVGNSRNISGKAYPSSKRNRADNIQKMAKTSKTAKGREESERRQPVRNGKAGRGKDPVQPEPEKDENKGSDDETESESPSPKDKRSSPVLDKFRSMQARSDPNGETFPDVVMTIDPKCEKLDEYLSKVHELDKRIKKDDRLGFIKLLRKQIYIKTQKIFMLKQLRQQDRKKVEEDKVVLDGTCQTLSARLKKVQAEHEALKKRYEQKLEDFSTKRKKPSGNDINKHLFEVVEKQCKGYLFSICKFISNEAQEINAARLMIKYSDLPKEAIATKEDRNKFVMTYKEIIKKTLFERRSYIATELRKIFLKYWYDQHKQFPTLDQFIKCLERKIDIKLNDDMNLFISYVEEFLPKVVGAVEWTQKIRPFTTISNAIRQNTTKPLISSSDEAFLVLTVANCIQRWTEECKEDEKRPKNERKEKSKNVNGIFTKCDSGQCKYGGWNAEGMKYYNDLVEKSNAAREDPRCKEVEEACLEHIRRREGITAKSWAEHVRRKRRRGSNLDDQEEVDGDVLEEPEVVIAMVEMVESDGDD
jgi:hypothetical protein